MKIRLDIKYVYGGYFLLGTPPMGVLMILDIHFLSSEGQGLFLEVNEGFKHFVWIKR